MRYSCVEGYRMEGAAVLNCLHEGYWDTSPPRCIQVDCGPPPTGDNVVVEGNSTTYGSQVCLWCGGEMGTPAHVSMHAYTPFHVIFALI